MADMNERHILSKNCISSVGTKKCEKKKESIISVRYGWVNLSLGSLFGIIRQSIVMPKQ